MLETKVLEQPGEGEPRLGLSLLEDGQAVWMTKNLVNWIRKEFYEPPAAFQHYAGPRWTPDVSPDHHRSDCEACLAGKEVPKLDQIYHKYTNIIQISSLKVSLG